MREFKYIILLILWIATAQASAQMQTPPPEVYIYVEEKTYAMKAVTSQTELKKGWDIQGVNVGRKTVRYFWGAHAQQLTDTQPRFAIYPRQGTLNDFALLRLKTKKTHRRLPAAQLSECEYTRVELTSFRIDNLPDMGFAITPIHPLTPGEYIIVDLSCKPINEYGDIRAYDFQVTTE
ncbi:MAG: hypothetical protein NC388_05580 [Clostridium sp.]|nr:hypothetical protein [Clostridium sp.]